MHEPLGQGKKCNPFLARVPAKDVIANVTLALVKNS
jgi:hypothetical protein